MIGNLLQLVEPTESLHNAFRIFVEDFGVESLEEIDGIGSMCGAEFAQAVRNCRDHADGRNLPEGWVPASTWWLVRDNNAIVGTINLRHNLTPFLEAEGGHIGYAVCPKERGKGYATYMLALIVEIARNMGIKRLLITCDEDNPASQKVVINNGGILENEIVSENSGKVILRYWIDLEKGFSNKPVQRTV